jgi:hypothetical protein
LIVIVVALHLAMCHGLEAELFPLLAGEVIAVAVHLAFVFGFESVHIPESAVVIKGVIVGSVTTENVKGGISGHVYGDISKNEKGAISGHVYGGISSNVKGLISGHVMGVISGHVVRVISGHVEGVISLIGIHVLVLSGLKVCHLEGGSGGSNCGRNFEFHINVKK